MIKISDYPQLQLITWNIHCNEISDDLAFELYEVNWRFIDESSLLLNEKELINRLKVKYGDFFIKNLK